jgi:hypothetical protein
MNGVLIGLTCGVWFVFGYFVGQWRAAMEVQEMLDKLDRLR